MDKKSFILYYDYFDTLSDLSDEEIGILIRALADYSKNGIVPELNSNLKMAFNFIKIDIDNNNKKYNETCERNKNNGSRGGRPKIQLNPKNPVGFSKTQPNPKNPISDTDKDTDTDKDNEPEPGNDTDTEKDKNKKNKFAEFVSMTNAEHMALIDKHGETATNRAIERLDNYKGSTGRKYKSDYRTILNWVMKEVIKESKQSSYNGSLF